MSNSNEKGYSDAQERMQEVEYNKSRQELKVKLKEELAELAEKLKVDRYDPEASGKVGEILKEEGRLVCEGTDLHSEYTSENIAFIELGPDLFMEVSISGSFDVSYVRVLDQAGVDKRLDQIEEVNKELNPKKE